MTFDVDTRTETPTAPAGWTVDGHWMKVEWTLLGTLVLTLECPDETHAPETCDLAAALDREAPPDTVAVGFQANQLQAGGTAVAWRGCATWAEWVPLGWVEAAVGGPLAEKKGAR